MFEPQNLDKQVIKNQSADTQALAFISAGVACYAFSLIDDLGMIDLLCDNGKLSVKHLLSYPNPLLLQTAFLTLERHGIIERNRNYFYLSNFGKDLSKHRASIGLIYSGYRNLFSHQLSLAKDEPMQHWELVDSLSVAKASVHFGKNIINEMILNTIQSDFYKGGICDLGCGAATRLLYLCRNTKLKGYGFDLSKASIKNARKNLKTTDKISMQVKDITKIDGVYPDVEILLQAFVMHDLSDDLCQKTISSYRSTFPNTKLFIYIDAVVSNDISSEQLPGFEYVHGLMGIKLRDKKKTLKLFTSSGFDVHKELSIPSHPHCYIWVLTPAITREVIRSE